MSRQFLLIAALCYTFVHGLEPIVVHGQRLFEAFSGKPFVVQGIDYYPRPNAGYFDKNNIDFFTDNNSAIWEPHIAEFQALNINTVRIYAVDPSQSHDKFMCALSAAGIYVMVELAASCPGCYISADPYPACYNASVKLRGQQIISKFSKYNNLLSFSAGNEVNHLVKDPRYNAPCQKKFIRDMRAYTNACNSTMRPVPIGIAQADTNRTINMMYYSCRTDPTDELESVDWYGLNVYLQCNPNATAEVEGPGFVELKNQLKIVKATAPVLLTEYGCLNPRFPTIDGYAAQRTWVQVPWIIKDPDLLAGGFAFEFSTELRNSKADSPYPFTSFGKQNYGVGYFSPQDCDHINIPCKYNRMPNFEYLAKQYAQLANRTSQFPSKNQYTSYRTQPPACPEGYAALNGTTWRPDAVDNLKCPNYIHAPVCPGDIDYFQNSTGAPAKLENDTIENLTVAPQLTKSSSRQQSTRFLFSNFARSGPVYASIALLFMASANIYASVAMSKTMLAAPKWVQNYGDLGEWIGGKYLGRYTVVIPQLLACLLTACAFLVLGGVLLNVLFPNAFSSTVWILLMALTAVPGSLIPTLKESPGMAMAGCLATLAADSIALAVLMIKMDTQSIAPPSPQASFEQISTVFGNLSLAYGAGIIIPTLQRQHSQPERMQRVITITLSLITVLFTIIASLGYSVLGCQMSRNLLFAIAGTDLGFTASRGSIVASFLAMQVHITIAFTVVLHPAFFILERLISKNHRQEHNDEAAFVEAGTPGEPKTPEVVETPKEDINIPQPSTTGRKVSSLSVRLILISAVVAVAIAFQDHVMDLQDFVGASTMSLTCLILPLIFYFSKFWKTIPLYEKIYAVIVLAVCTALAFYVSINAGIALLTPPQTTPYPFCDAKYQTYVFTNQTYYG
ncbi:glycoside hydrolase [Thraustotheca clavata]|uniref:Glycoside hydrolase n=1 Tax=Thraustotheca clavata TaxID=74557 RepID=A0A1V9YVN5_9STRA|nr:glycoside hydrolase [Thraustotheca clavata]